MLPSAAELAQSWGASKARNKTSQRLKSSALQESILQDKGAGNCLGRKAVQNPNPKGREDTGDTGSLRSPPNNTAVCSIMFPPQQILVDNVIWTQINKVCLYLKPFTLQSFIHPQLPLHFRCSDRLKHQFCLPNTCQLSDYFSTPNERQL